jgi:hypothetical protein
MVSIVCAMIEAAGDGACERVADVVFEAAVDDGRLAWLPGGGVVLGELAVGCEFAKLQF